MAGIAVIGTGYVGITTAVGLASLGHSVMGYDVLPDKLEELNSGRSPIYEPGLEDSLRKNLGLGNLTFTDKIKVALQNAEFVFICVPTPQDEDGSADLSYVINAVTSISKFISSKTVIVTKSTVPVGSARKVKQALNRNDIPVVSNPEFLREGTALEDFHKPDRIIIGADDQLTASRVAKLYEAIEAPVVLTSLESAELVKYAANAFLATKISFINEIAAICFETGAEISDVAFAMGLDGRIGNRFLNPGPGWGGSCFPKDTKALIATAEKLGLNLPVVSGAVESNSRTLKRVVDLLENNLNGNLHGKKIGILGITFKASTDDTRDSPALKIANRILDRGACLKAFDPIGQLPDHQKIEQVKSIQDAIVGTDAVVILTEWPEFKNISPEIFENLMKGDLVFDARFILNKEDFSKSKLRYITPSKPNSKVY